ncbi:neuferricin-like [Littorina saxatilis]|uniref:neuferricin-like n=1 Tax=Littorina saxatilis TaxID=31220 RepID=UPI0038B5ED95
MGRTLLGVSLAVLTLSLFLRLDSLAPIRSQLSEITPRPVVSFFREAKQAAVSLVFKQDRVFTKKELSKYTGENGRPVYVAIVGQVYDVTRGQKHYGPGGGYNFFAGRDGSKAFVTGDFSEKGVTDDISGFTNAEILSLDEWKGLYDRDYIYVGKVVGKFYTAEGKPTAALDQYYKGLAMALAEKKADEDLRQTFPSCNSQWNEKDDHTLVWCSLLSGGIKRDWVGVPRQYFQPGKSKDKPRCACVRNTGPPSGARDKQPHNNRGDLDNPHLKLYDGCDANSDKCMYKRS